MTEKNNLAQPLPTASLCRPLLIGAGIAFTLISIFLLGVKHPDPAWPAVWWIRPLAVVTIAGAVGGSFYYFMNRLTIGGGWKRIAAIIVSVIVYIFGLWMGTVLGLAGTLWH
jgi:hypothetical protein